MANCPMSGIKSFFCTGYPGGKAGLGLLALRLVWGAAFIFHGWGKMQAPFNWMGDAVPGFLQFLAAFSEFGGGIAIILGLLTPLAALGLFCTMSFAAFGVHIPNGDPFVASGPGQGSYEPALVYWAISLMFILIGPGAYSLDAKIWPKLQKND